MRRMLGAAVALLVLATGGCRDARKDESPPPITSVPQEQPGPAGDGSPD
jgi:hypothetical protein